MPLLYTGARLMEIQTLKWEHVRGDRIHLRDAKTGGRVVPLGPEARAVLSAIPRDEDNPWVIAGRLPGSHLTDQQRPWRRIRKRADLEDVRIHDLRHTCASWPDFLAAKKVIKRCNWISFSLFPKPPDIAIYNPKSYSHRIHSNI